MNIASRQSFWNSGVKIAKGAYIRSIDGKLGYAISKASPGFGHYRISWRGSISVGSPAAGNGWTGPMGTIAYLQGTNEYFRWYVTDPSDSSKWQHAFWNQYPNVYRSDFPSVYGEDGSTKCGWIVLDQDMTTGTKKASSIYTGESLDNLTLVNTCYSTINASVLPAICFGIFGSVSKANAEPCVELSEIDPTQCSIPPAGSRFFNFKLEKDGVMIHDCYPTLVNGKPAIYDIITGEYAVETCGGTAEYGIDSNYKNNS